MSETMHGAMGQPGSPAEYQPRHAAPQINSEPIEQQAYAANEYRYAQLQKQFGAEYALSRGQLAAVVVPERRRRYTERQQQAIDRAKARQEMADRYARKKYAQAQDARGRRGPRASPRHLRDEPEVEGPPAPPQIAEPLGAIAVPDNVHVPSPRSRPTNAITGLDILPEPEPKDTITGLDILFEQEEVEATAPSTEPVPRPTGIKARAGRAWRRANVAFAGYFNDPEKGRRRQIAATLGLYAVLGATAWAVGHHPLSAHEHSGATQPPASTPASPPPPEPTPTESPAPPVEPSPPQSAHDASFFDNLHPTNYHGEAYEWGAVADQVGPNQATPELLDMVHHARQAGAIVDIQGNPQLGHWQINSVTVEVQGGEYRTYYDTPHKLALLEYLSKLRLDD